MLSGASTRPRGTTGARVAVGLAGLYWVLSAATLAPWLERIGHLPPSSLALVIGALAERPDPAQLRWLIPLAGHPDPSVRLAALQSLGSASASEASIEKLLAVADTAPAEARAAAQRVQSSGTGAAAQAAAQAVINHLERFEDFLNEWVLAGPFTRDGATDQQLFSIEFPPEQTGAAVAWRAVHAVSGIVPLDQLVGGDNRVAYLRVTLVSPSTQAARLEMGSDDGLKVWLNGNVVHANNINRGYLAGEDKVPVSLKAGANVQLVKVTQGGGGWAVGVRIRAADGSRIQGLQTKAE